MVSPERHLLLAILLRAIRDTRQARVAKRDREDAWLFLSDQTTASWYEVIGVSVPEALKANGLEVSAQ